MRVNYWALLISALLIVGCSGNNPKQDTNFESRFKKGMDYFDKKKYLKAQDEFSFVALGGMHTDVGDDAQFYLAESYYLNKEYVLALSEYDRLVRRLGYSPFVEKARWRICQCYVKESPKYYHDQDNTEKALTKLQEFIEDYPRSEYRVKAETTIIELREKLSRKAYETGVLYIKLGAYDSAVLAFGEVLSKYYDTSQVEAAHLGIIQSYCMDLNIEKAEAYYQSHKNTIRSKQSKDKVKLFMATAHRKIDQKSKE